MIIVDADPLPKLGADRQDADGEDLRGGYGARARGLGDDLPNAIDYEDFIAGKPTCYDWPEIDENSPMGLCYTSGTTGAEGQMYTTGQTTCTP